MEPDFFRDPSIIADPRSYFDAMRARCPVARESHHGAVMVTGYEEALEVLNRKDDAFSAAASVIGPIPPLPFEIDPEDITEQLAKHRDELPWSAHLSTFDGQKHVAHRALLTNLLTYKRLKDNEDYLHSLADRIIDRFIARGACNIVPEFAHAITTYAISDLLGIPEADRAELLELIGAPPSQVEGDAVHKLGPDPLIFMKPRFDEYLKQRQESGGSDLLAELARSRLKDGTQPDLNMLSALARFLFGAGQDTTSRLIAMAVKVLAEDPGLQQRVRAEPARIPDLLEEVLRHDAPVKTSYRLAVRRTHVGDLDIDAGTVVAVCLSAANNDPRRFEEPARIDIDRPNRRDHMAFSRGVHGCPGAPLARMESRVAIERLLARSKEIRLSDEHHGPEGARTYRFEPTYSFRNLADLFIEFDPA
jgi:cytochrome P450